MRHHKYTCAFAYQAHEGIQNMVSLIRIRKHFIEGYKRISINNIILLYVFEYCTPSQRPRIIAKLDHVDWYLSQTLKWHIICRIYDIVKDYII